MQTRPFTLSPKPLSHEEKVRLQKQFAFYKRVFAELEKQETPWAKAFKEIVRWQLSERRQA